MRLVLWLSLLATAGTLGCGDDDAGPAVRITGAHSVVVGRTATLAASTVDGVDPSYDWLSEDPSIAEVDAGGVVTGLAPGETTIRATGGRTGAVGTHAMVVVTAPVAVVRISGDTLVTIGGSTTLTATTQNGTDGTYTWESSDAAVASVDAVGVVTGRAPGRATITATGDDTGASATVGIIVAAETPYLDRWLSSAHADASAEAFTHWNEDDPPEIPTECAHCHGTLGYRDFLGEDGSAAGVVDVAPPGGGVIECNACHNASAEALDTVRFPSGVEVTGLGDEARCMVCHQGRGSTDTVDAAIAMAAPPDDDTTSDALRFVNQHYYAAGATLNAGRVRGGYQYDGSVYDWRFRHAPGVETCVDCHDAHTLEVELDSCAGCHAGVDRMEELQDIRMLASVATDYDGDGDLREGIYWEMTGLRDLLLEAVRAYPAAFGRDAICYSETSYPYFFVDTDGDGACSDTEATFSNQYRAWSARLVRAAYNLHVAYQDPGAWAHNAKYVIQLLYDSIADLNTALPAPVDLSAAERNDPGHFNGASEAARHWDEDEMVRASCSRCHSGSDGFRFFVTYGFEVDVPEPDSGLDCATCHDAFGPRPEDYSLVSVGSVELPSGIAVDDGASNLCMTCHQGRVAAVDIDASIAARRFRFLNVHYLPAAGTLYGSDGGMGYEYPARTYAARMTGHPGGDSCLQCHEAVLTEHTFEPADNVLCATRGCHSPLPSIDSIRLRRTADYDGDGSTTEPLRAELETLGDALLAAMQAYATPGPCYEPSVYPYFFADTDGNGTCSATEAVRANGFAGWDAELMKAAHNFQIMQKEPGAWAHNFDYVAQLLHDSIEALGGDVSAYTRP